MIHAVTGTPGAKKTAFVVSKLDKTERDNKVNLVKNKKYFAENKPIMKKFASDFSYYENEIGSGVDTSIESIILDDNYFDMFEQDFDELRPDDYYLRSIRYNDICERINEREGVQGFKGLLPVRTIYTNIKALKIEYTRSLKDLLDDGGNVDWRKAPDGSIIVIDEIQNIKPFSDEKSQMPIIKDLTEHRHRGFDFYVITQFPSLLNRVVKWLVGVHYHLTVPYGMTTKVYQHGSCKDRPDTTSSKLMCETKFNFNPPDRIFKLYKSTTINTHQKRLPYKQLSMFAIFIFGALGIFIYGFNGTSNSSLVNHDKKVTVATKNTDKQQQNEVVVMQNHIQQAQSTQDLHQLEMQRVAMVFASESTCTAKNSYGQIIDMSYEECKKYSDDPRLISSSYLPPRITYDNFKQASSNI